MKSLRLFYACVLLLWPVPVLAADQVFDAHDFTLPNGLYAVVIPNHRAPVVTHMIWYKAGAGDEPFGQSGIAHFLEHLMFKGSKGLQPGEFSRRIRALGGQDNAFTSHDFTAYFQSVPAAQLETVMRLEAGRMRGLNPPPASFTSEHQVIIEERRQRIDNDPQARLSEAMDAALFVNHPYGRPIIGWEDEMATLTWAQAKAFYDIWYAPNNAVLVISGDVDPAAVEKLAKKIYGPLKPETIPARHRPTVPDLAASPTLVMNDTDIQQTQLAITYRAPSFRTNRKDALALQVLAEILDGGPSGQLYQSFVANTGRAIDIGVSYDPQAWDETDFTFYAVPADATDPKQLASDIKNLPLWDSKTWKKDIESAKRRLQSRAIYARDSLSGPAMIIGRALASGASLHDVQTWPQQIAAITADDITAAAQRCFHAGRPVVTGVAQKPVTP